MSEIIHKELSYAVVGCIFDVHNAVGPGVREECYQKAVQDALRELAIPFIAKPKTRCELVYRSDVIDVFEPDFVVNERLILELKHLAEGLTTAHESQVLNYLKFWNIELGLLANFAYEKAVIVRIPRQPSLPQIDEHYESIGDLIRPEHKPTLREIREGLLTIFQSLGLGYTATTYRNAALVELRARRLDVHGDAIVQPHFHERQLPQSPISPLIINECVCLQVDAINDHLSARQVRTIQTHLQLTAVPLGIVAIFGRRKMSIYGVRPP